MLIIDIMFCPREEPNSVAHGLITNKAKNDCDPILRNVYLLSIFQEFFSICQGWIYLSSLSPGKIA